MTQGTPLLLLRNRPYLFFVISLIVLWLATRVGVWARRHRLALPATTEDDFNLILGATLTLLGLLIGFTFSMASGRYDRRKNFEEEEANAIGTEYIRADLLPPADGAGSAPCCASSSIDASLPTPRAIPSNSAETAPPPSTWNHACGPP